MTFLRDRRPKTKSKLFSILKKCCLIVLMKNALSTTLSYHMYLTQMVNTRRGGGIDLPPNRHTRWIYRQPQPQPAKMNPPNPPQAELIH
jgi:hypothetical protein